MKGTWISIEVVNQAEVAHSCMAFMHMMWVPSLNVSFRSQTLDTNLAIFPFYSRLFESCKYRLVNFDIAMTFATFIEIFFLHEYGD